jgi:transposase-like protein
MLGFRPPTERKARRQWWRRHIERQQDAGISVAEFCRRHAVHPTTFYAWRRRLGLGPVPAQATPVGWSPSPRRQPDTGGEPATFLPVSLRGAETTAQLEIALGNNRVVRLSGAINAQLLRAAIRAAGQLDAHDRGGV